MPLGTEDRQSAAGDLNRALSMDNARAGASLSRSPRALILGGTWLRTCTWCWRLVTRLRFLFCQMGVDGDSRCGGVEVADILCLCSAGTAKGAKGILCGRQPIGSDWVGCGGWCARRRPPWPANSTWLDCEPCIPYSGNALGINVY